VQEQRQVMTRLPVVVVLAVTLARVVLVVAQSFT
jgi:hypothetical protein